MTANASTAVIRQWARAQGMAVGDRGRLSPQVLDAYSASQRRSAPAPAVSKTNKKRGHAQLRVTVRPMPGATGTARTIAARAA